MKSTINRRFYQQLMLVHIVYDAFYKPTPELQKTCLYLNHMHEDVTHLETPSGQHHFGFNESLTTKAK